MVSTSSWRRHLLIRFREKVGVHLGVHNPRKIRSLPVTLVMRKGNESTKR